MGSTAVMARVQPTNASSMLAGREPKGAVSNYLHLEQYSPVKGGKLGSIWKVRPIKRKASAALEMPAGSL